MTEDFSDNSNAKFSDVNAIDYYQQINNTPESGVELHNPYDQIYAPENRSIVNETVNRKFICQTAESEVRFLKEWLLLHLDLIQQQNEEILSKERTILILQQENEMLKERITCMEQAVSLEVGEHFGTHSEEPTLKEESFGDMTQDLGSCEDNKDSIHFEVNYNDVDSTTLDLDIQHSSSTLNCETTTQTCVNTEDTLIKHSGDLNFDSGIDLNIKPDSDKIEHSDSSVTYNFSSELDSMRHLKMSIRRKRVCSNSSALSQNGSAVDEKKAFRRIRKKRKRSLRDNQIVTTPDLYVNQINDTIPGISVEPESSSEVSNDAVLEVPRWRVKVYASCYSMEGTENLDDDVFLRRHNRLEVDERRRKRWDVQRIREQRVIEKLKQRQERIDSNMRTGIADEMSNPFWSTLDEIKFIEVSEELPIAAFGAPIPKFASSDFSLPWLNNPVTVVKKEKPPMKRGRRRKLKR